MKTFCRLITWLAAGFMALTAQGSTLRWSDVKEPIPLSAASGPLVLAREKSRPGDGSVEALFLPPVTGAVKVELLEKEERWKPAGEFPATAGAWTFLSITPEWQAMAGQSAIRLSWKESDKRTEAVARFAVEAKPAAISSGTVRLTVPNTGTVVSTTPLPFSLGVPFPPGALMREENLVLRDSGGNELPLQTRVMARWSPQGAIRWLLCDFVAPVTSKDEAFTLEFGPEVRRVTQSGEPMVSKAKLNFPIVKAGTLSVNDRGITLSGEPVVAWQGGPEGFVENEAGKRFITQGAWNVEETGPLKTVLKQAGDYRAANGETFCRFVTRMTLFRGSPLVRMQHTWIFTGDAYRDRIRNMGIEIQGIGIQGLERGTGAFALEHRSDWAQGETLVQLTANECEWVNGDAVERGGRSAGLAMMEAKEGQPTLFLGVDDFWQNFPQQLAVKDGKITFYQWPKDRKRPNRPFSIATANHLWFAHEGELLDFAIPREYVTPPLIDQLGRHRLGDGKYLETVNAQGIAKTADLTLWIGHAAERDTIRRAHDALDSGELRAVVDPAWLAASGVFHEIHPKDPARFPTEEAAYELQARAPYLWAEQIGFFGKWIHGDMTWEPNLREKTSHPYRAFRKMHQGWPYSWIPYARSGDPQYYPFAQAALRHITDIAFCHYSDGAVPTYNPATGKPERARPRGFYKRFHIPWGSQDWDKGPTSRGYIDKADFLLQGYYLTGDARVRDVLDDWIQLIKTEGNGMRGLHDHSMFQTPETPADILKGDWGRTTVTLIGTFTDLYQATFDPWFLAAARQMAETQVGAWRSLGWRGQFWNPGPRDYLRFNRSKEYQEFYLDYVEKWIAPETDHVGDHYAESYPMMEPAAFAYELTRETRYLRRLQSFVDAARENTYDGLPVYNAGMRVRGGNRGAGPQYTGYYLQHLPLALHALAHGMENGNGRITPWHSKFFQLPTNATPEKEGKWILEFPATHIRKAAGKPLALRFGAQEVKPKPEPWEIRITGPEFEEKRSWDPQQFLDITIPAEAPEGTYQVTLHGSSAYPLTTYRKALPGVYFPISAPETPEVAALDKEGWIGPAFESSRYAFKVPADQKRITFRCRFVPLRKKDCSLVRFTLWNRAGKCVGKFQADRLDLKADEVVFTIPVPKEAVGEIWELVASQPHAGVQFDKSIVPWVATELERWFQP